MLGNPTGLTRHDIGRTDLIEQERLPVVDVTHNGHDRRTRLQRRRIILFLFDLGLGDVLLFLLRGEIELVEK